jgi:type VI secretion system ImpM family protein
VKGQGLAAVFAFGKLPAHGDFISRGLDDAAVEAGDEAVANAVALAAGQWDTLWDDVYVETPVWRFIASPGVIGQEWTAGAFLASVDAVGRQFPLVAGFSAPSLGLLGRPADTAAAIERVEAACRDALVEGRAIDSLMERLAEEIDGIFGAAPPSHPVALFAGDLLGALDARPWTPQSLWWVAGAAEAPIRCEGALSGEMLAPLFRRYEAPVDSVAPVEPAVEAAVEPPPEPAATPVNPQVDQDNAKAVVVSSPQAGADEESGGAHEDAEIPNRA